MLSSRCIRHPEPEVHSSVLRTCTAAEIQDVRGLWNFLLCVTQNPKLNLVVCQACIICLPALVAWWNFVGLVEHAVLPKVFDLDKLCSTVQQQLSVFRVAVIWGCTNTSVFRA